MEKKVKALKTSAYLILSVAAIEIVIGITVNSLAIVSDGTHALLDFASIFMLLLATKFSLKPPDEEHMYGHEKIEIIGGFIGGIILSGTAIFLIVEAIQRLLHGELLNLDWGFAGFISIGYTLIIDILRVKILHPLEHESATTKAGFYHTIADLGSTLIALFGFGAATLGLHFFDSLASIILCTALCYLSIDLIRECIVDLIDYAPKDIVKEIERLLTSSIGSISKIRKIRVRKSGKKVFVEVTIKVPANMNIEDAHAIALKAEEELKRISEKVEVITHICPDSIYDHC